MRINKNTWHYKMYVSSFGDKGAPKQTDICRYVAGILFACLQGLRDGIFFALCFVALSIVNFFSVVLAGYGITRITPGYLAPDYRPQDEDMSDSEPYEVFVCEPFPLGVTIMGRRIHVSFFVKIFWLGVIATALAFYGLWSKALLLGAVVLGMVAFLAIVVSILAVAAFLLFKIFGGAGVAFEFLKAKASGYCTIIMFDEECA